MFLCFLIPCGMLPMLSCYFPTPSCSSCPEVKIDAWRSSFLCMCILPECPNCKVQHAILLHACIIFVVYIYIRALDAVHNTHVYLVLYVEPHISICLWCLCLQLFLPDLSQHTHCRALSLWLPLPLSMHPAVCFFMIYFLPSFGRRPYKSPVRLPFVLCRAFYFAFPTHRACLYELAGRACSRRQIS